MPNTKNIKGLKEIEEKLESTKALFLANYSGLTVGQQQELRKLVKEAGGELKVTKNTLLKIALKNKGVDVDKISDELEGHNITLFALDDAVSPLKVVVKYGQDNEKPVLKTGILDKEILSLEKVIELSKLPSKLELIAKLIGQIQAPISGMVNVLSAPTRNLVYVLNAIKEKSQNNN